MPFKSEQVDKFGAITLDFCSKLTEKELIRRFSNAAATNFSSNPLIYKHNNHKIKFILRNIVYSGNPLPLNKKRVQVLAKYIDLLKQPNVFLLGLYSYDEQNICCIFNPLRYTKAKTKSYTSSHIKTIDLINARNDVFENNNGDYLFEISNLDQALCMILD